MQANKRNGRNMTVGMRVTEYEKRRMVEAAEREGRTLSNWMLVQLLAVLDSQARGTGRPR